jgi:hypothetical protein
MVGEPPAPAGIQIVVAYTLSAGGGVNETTVPRIDRDVAYSSTLRKQHEVADGERAGRWLDGDACPGHLA